MNTFIVFIGLPKRSELVYVGLNVCDSWLRVQKEFEGEADVAERVLGVQS